MPEPAKQEKLKKRSGIVAFMMCGSGPNFTRMQHFTSMAKSMNAKEYTRAEVDVDGDVTDVTGYAPSIAYAFDRYLGNKVHDEIVKICNEELKGTDAVRKVVLVDMDSDPESTGTYQAQLRSYAVVPDTEGDSTDAYTYAGNLKSNGQNEKVQVTLNSDKTEATLSPGK